MAGFYRRQKSKLKNPYSYSLGLLGRRDYSRQQLYEKLIQRGYLAGDANAALDELVAEGWLDDFRYGAQLCRRLIERGYGPYYIRQAWQQKGVSPQASPRRVVTWAAIAELINLTGAEWSADQCNDAPADLDALLAAYEDDFWLFRARCLVQDFTVSRWPCAPQSSIKIWRRALCLLQRRGYPGQCVRAVLGPAPITDGADT
jgi:hypothetical protein